MVARNARLVCSHGALRLRPDTCKSYLRRKTFYAAPAYVNSTGKFTIFLCFEQGTHTDIDSPHHRQVMSWGQVSGLLKPRSSSLRYKVTQLHQKLITFHARDTGGGMRRYLGIVTINDQPTCQDQKHQSLIGINWIFQRCLSNGREGQ